MSTVDDIDFEFTIDNYTPDTIPMSRLAEYMADLAQIVGFKERVHFTHLRRHSLGLAFLPDNDVRANVSVRLDEIKRGNCPSDARRALKSLNQRLQQDNAKGFLTERGDNVLVFPGRESPRPVTLKSVRERGTLQGQMVSIMGRDRTKHIHLQDGYRVYPCETLDLNLVRELLQYMFGPTIRVTGVGWWERREDEEWHLSKFTIHSYEVLDNAPLSEVMRRLGSLETEWKDFDDPLRVLHQLRHGNEDEE